jgi:hypothetical protein
MKREISSFSYLINILISTVAEVTKSSSMVTSWTTEMMEAVFGRTNYSVIIMMLIL